MSAADISHAELNRRAMMANDPGYDAVLSLARSHLQNAWDNFYTDPRGLPWRKLPGNSPKVRAQVWVDALKAELAHYQQIERNLS